MRGSFSAGYSGGLDSAWSSSYSMDRWIDGIWMARNTPRSRHRHAPRLAAKLPDDPQLEEASAMFRALGDPARLRLLAHLAGGEVCVSELAELEDDNLTTVSARLKTLYAVRLVKRRREAKHIYYALSDDHVLQLVESAIEHAAERHNT
jgi:ArsR family transcriptional regulator, lead/cadmium/zinc/bismuth-responsive transcriptional repressor